MVFPKTLIKVKVRSKAVKKPPAAWNI